MNSHTSDIILTEHSSFFYGSESLKRIWLIFFIAFVLWIGLIFYFSTRLPDESSKQANFAYNLLKKLDKTFDFSDTQLFIKLRTTLNRFWFGDRRASTIEFIRKSAHFGLYLFLGSLCFLFGLFYTQKFFAAILLGLSLPSLIASLDEYSQQYFNRGSSLNDVIIDISGATFGVILTFLVSLIVMLIVKIIHHKDAQNQN